MDPISITGTVLSLTAHCVSTAKALHDLRERYQHAQVTISAICSEATVISTSLTTIQRILLSNPDALSSQKQYRPDLEAAFDTALMGCTVVFAVLDSEVQELNECRQDSFKVKRKFLWKEETMKELLMQLRGQQTGLTLLIQVLQMESTAEMSRVLEQNNEMLRGIAHRTVSLRESHPRVKAPISIFASSIDDVGSIYSARASTAGATTFEFDSLLANSRVYQRAFSSGYLRRGVNTGKAESSIIPYEDDRESTSEDGFTIVNAASEPQPEKDSSSQDDPVQKWVEQAREMNRPVVWHDISPNMKPTMDVQAPAILITGEKTKSDKVYDDEKEVVNTESATQGDANSVETKTPADEYKELRAKYTKVKTLYWEQFDRLKLLEAGDVFSMLESSGNSITSSPRLEELSTMADLERPPAPNWMSSKNTAWHYAMAALDFYPTQPDEISLRTGEKIKITEWKGLRWLGINAQGDKGYFPAARLIVGNDTHMTAYVIKDREAAEAGELALKAKTWIYSINRLNERWWFGRDGLHSNAKVGYFPADHVYFPSADGRLPPLLPAITSGSSEES